MIARTPDELIDTEALTDLYAATARQAVLDLKKGPGWTAKQQHAYRTACVFLERAGLLEKVVEHYGLTLEAVDCQLELFAA